MSDDFPHDFADTGVINVPGGVLPKWYLLFMAALWIMEYGRPLYFHAVVSIFISLPNLSRRRMDVYHTSAHDAVLVRIPNAGLKRAARGSLEMQDPKKSPSGHHRTTLLGHIFATKARIDSRKKTC